MKYSSNVTPQQLLFHNTFNFFDEQSGEMSRCWRGGPVGSTSVCFHKGLIFIMHYATLNAPHPPPPHPSSIYQNLQEGALARPVGGKEKLGRIQAARSCIPEKKGGKCKKKKKKLTGQTMSLERRSCSIFVSDDGLINHSNESGEAGNAGKQKQMS